MHDVADKQTLRRFKIAAAGVHDLIPRCSRAHAQIARRGDRVAGDRHDAGKIGNACAQRAADRRGFLRAEHGAARLGKIACRVAAGDRADQQARVGLRIFVAQREKADAVVGTRRGAHRVRRLAGAFRHGDDTAHAPEQAHQDMNALDDVLGLVAERAVDRACPDLAVEAADDQRIGRGNLPSEHGKDRISGPVDDAGSADRIQNGIGLHHLPVHRAGERLERSEAVVFDRDKGHGAAGRQNAVRNLADGAGDGGADAESGKKAAFPDDLPHPDRVAGIYDGRKVDAAAAQRNADDRDVLKIDQRLVHGQLPLRYKTYAASEGIRHDSDLSFQTADDKSA